MHRNSANDGFHEGIGDTLALSVTPEYLVTIGCSTKAPDPGGDLGLLLRMALDKVAFLPFGLLVDQYRWKVFSGEIAPDEFNAGWWELRTKYQGIRPPVERTRSRLRSRREVPRPGQRALHALLPGAHPAVPVPSRAVRNAAGFEGPLHRCSIYGNRKERAGG